MLKILAPFVTPDSFVEGRDSGWRIAFVDGRLEERCRLRYVNQPVANIAIVTTGASATAHAAT